MNELTSDLTIASVRKHIVSVFQYSEQVSFAFARKQRATSIDCYGHAMDVSLKWRPWVGNVQCPLRLDGQVSSKVICLCKIHTGFACFQHYSVI